MKTPIIILAIFILALAGCDGGFSPTDDVNLRISAFLQNNIVLQDGNIDVTIVPYLDGPDSVTTNVIAYIDGLEYKTYNITLTSGSNAIKDMWTISGVGTHNLTFLIDRENNVTETNEDDNSFTAGVTITARQVCTTNCYCGDGKMGPGETEENCCQDTGCSNGRQCGQDNSCFLYSEGHCEGTLCKDLDVTNIQRTPLYQNYVVVYDRNSVPTIDIPVGIKNQVRKHWPDEGETVTFTAHVINKGADEIQPFYYEWFIDGVSQGKKQYTSNLASGGEALMTMQWAWKKGDHTVAFKADPDNALAEVSEQNNYISDPTNGLSFKIFFDKESYDVFNSHENAYGSYSTEDWFKWQFEQMRDVFAESTYNVLGSDTPVNEKIRIDKFYAAPAEDLNELMVWNAEFGGCENEREIDVCYEDSRWAFLCGTGTLECNGVVYDCTDAVQRTQFWDCFAENTLTQTDWGLIHEMTHQLGIVDLYRIGFGNDQNLVNSVGYSHNYNTSGIMGGGDVRPHYDENLYSSHTATALNINKGYRRGYFGDYLYDIPTTNKIRLKDVSGNALNGATLTFYQKQMVNGQELVTASNQVFTGTTDSEGVYTMPNRAVKQVTTETMHTIKANPFGQLSNQGFNGIFLIKIEKDNQVDYKFLDITKFNLEYWKGNKKEATYEMTADIAAGNAASGNAALGKTVTASSSQPGTSPSYLVDGNSLVYDGTWHEENSWKPTTSSMNEWVKIDLGDSNKVYKIVLHTPSFYEKFKILASTTGAFAGEQSTIVQEEVFESRRLGGKDGERTEYWIDYVFTPTDVRYLKIVPGADKDGVWLKEIEVYEMENCTTTYTYSCSDTDGGENWYIKGNVSASSGSSTICTGNSGGGGGGGGGKVSDYCFNTNVLTEYYCENNRSKAVNITCPYGCSNGICTGVTPIACTDTDGGLDYYTKGTAIENQGTMRFNETDACVPRAYPGQPYYRSGDEHRLQEVYCHLEDGDNEIHNQDYNCTNGCSNGACLQTACTHECTSYGSTSCATANSYRTCSNYDLDSCFEWSNATTCPTGQTCSIGSCVSTGTCTNECTSGTKECLSSNTYRTCADSDADGCTEWGNSTNCGTNQLCYSGICTSTCGTECINGTQQCSGNSYQICADQDLDHCLEWGTAIACSTGQTCSNGICSSGCTNECTNGAKECVTTTSYRTCGNYDTDSCYEWGTATNCQSSYKCSGGSCVRMTCGESGDYPTCGGTCSSGLTCTNTGSACQCKGCGDGVCSTGETCTNCPTDCGTCSGGGGGSSFCYVGGTITVHPCGDVYDVTVKGTVDLDGKTYCYAEDENNYLTYYYDQSLADCFFRTTTGVEVQDIACTPPMPTSQGPTVVLVHQPFDYCKAGSAGDLGENGIWTINGVDGEYCTIISVTGGQSITWSLDGDGKNIMSTAIVSGMQCIQDWQTCIQTCYIMGIPLQTSLGENCQSCLPWPHL